MSGEQISSGRAEGPQHGFACSLPYRGDACLVLRLGRCRVHPPRSDLRVRPTGSASSTFSSGTISEMDFDQSSKRPFALNKYETKIYSIHFGGPGSYTEVGAPFPLPVAGSSCCTDIAIDNTGGATAENLYYSPDGPPILGYTPAGLALPAFAPISGEKCGVAVDNEGHLWSGNFSTQNIEEFEPSGGAPIKTVDVSGTGRPCRVRFDLSNNDMYVSQYNGQGAIRYTAVRATRLGPRRFSTRQPTRTSRLTRQGTSST